MFIFCLVICHPHWLHSFRSLSLKFKITTESHFIFYRISKKDKATGKLKHINVNACLMPVLAADGCHVTTVEGVGSVKGDNLHPIQKAMTEMHGSQCGTFFFKPRICCVVKITRYANDY